MAEFSLEDGQAIVDQRTAPWVQELGIVVEEVGTGMVRMRMPFNEKLVHAGGVVCGQALMALADTAIVVGICDDIGRWRGMGTVSLNINFMRPAGAHDVTAIVRIPKSGRRLVFGDITLYGDDPDKPLAHATTTYALLPEKS